jgi:hypothetical protein
VPEETPSWHPVPYSRFIEEVKLHVPRFGFDLAGESYGLAREGMQMFGVLTFRGNGDYALALGLRNSYDKSLSVGIVVGMQVFVCDNLAFSGEVSMSRKHTVHVFRDLPNAIYRMLSRVSSLRTRQDEEIGRWKGLELDRRLANHILMESVRQDAIPVSFLPRVIQAYEKPQYEEFSPRTAWSLYNAFSGAVKSQSPRAQMENTLRVSRVFRDVLSAN